MEIKNVQERVKHRYSDFYFRKEIIGFESPCSDLLRKGEEIFEGCMISSVENENRKNDHCLVICLSAAGQQRYGWRLKNIAIDLVRNGKGKIDVLMPTFPCYSSRESEDQHIGGISWLSVVDSPISLIATNEEIRSLVKYYAQQYRYIILQGTSMGGCCAGSFAHTPIHDSNIKIGIVTVMGSREL